MITSPPRLLPMASHGCSCCGPASRADTASIPAASDSSAGGSSSSYQVTGLTCGHCAKSVTQALQALPQVDDVQVDLDAGGVSTVTVTGVAPPEMARRAIEDGRLRRLILISFTHHLDPDRVERKERHEHSQPFR